MFERFGVAFQPALVVVKPDGSTEFVAGEIEPALLDQIITEATG